KTSIFSHPVYLFLREFSLQDFRGGSQQLVMVGDYIAQQGTQVSFVANGIQFPTSQQASEYNKLIAPLPAQHQAFNQAWTTAVTATQ
ncbi:DUF3053 family protein, partial [Escherichia coli]|uniref:DUF3053 family protein n=1 Tax=Escherichia coli TaxID=562 RepID=UPI00207BCBB5